MTTVRVTLKNMLTGPIFFRKNWYLLGVKINDSHTRKTGLWYL